MRLTVYRKDVTPKSVIGELWINGERRAYTLEPPYRAAKPHAIPAGEYQITLRQSQKFGRPMPHVENVPGFEGIEIHWGNLPDDTNGCLLVGAHKDKDCITLSRRTFDDLWIELSRAEPPHSITYVDPLPLDPDISV